MQVSYEPSSGKANGDRDRPSYRLARIFEFIFDLKTSCEPRYFVSKKLWVKIFV